MWRRRQRQSKYKFKKQFPFQYGNFESGVRMLMFSKKQSLSKRSVVLLQSIYI